MRPVHSVRPRFWKYVSECSQIFPRYSFTMSIGLYFAIIVKIWFCDLPYVRYFRIDHTWAIWLMMYVIYPAFYAVFVRLPVSCARYLHERVLSLGISAYVSAMHGESEMPPFFLLFSGI